MAGWALITGASAGIGYELAKAFANAGYDLVLCARRRPLLEALAGELQALGRSTLVLDADLGRRSAIRRVLRRLAAAGIEPEVLVNNAGMARHGAFAEQDQAALEELIAVNVRGLTSLTRALLPGMLARRSGRILNIASVVAFQPVPALAVYAASKAYVLSFSEALAEELRGTGVSVTALCPGLTRTALLADLPPALQRYFEQVPMAQGVLLQEPDAVAREGLEACERGEVVRVPGVLNQWVTAWSQVQPRWLVRMLGGIAGRLALAQDVPRSS